MSAAASIPFGNKYQFLNKDLFARLWWNYNKSFRRPTQKTVCVSWNCSFKWLFYALCSSHISSSLISDRWIISRCRCGDGGRFGRWLWDVSCIRNYWRCIFTIYVLFYSLVNLNFVQHLFHTVSGITTSRFKNSVYSI